MFYFVYEKQDFEDDALMDLEPMKRLNYWCDVL